jgi:hypothetical protein
MAAFRTSQQGFVKDILAAKLLVEAEVAAESAASQGLDAVFGMLASHAQVRVV